MDRSTFRTDDMGCPPWSWYFSKVNLATGGKDLVSCLPILYPSCEFRLIGLQVHRGLTWINRPKWGLQYVLVACTSQFQNPGTLQLTSSDPKQLVRLDLCTHRGKIPSLDPSPSAVEGLKHFKCMCIYAFKKTTTTTTRRTTRTTFTYIFYYILWFNIIVAGCILILVRFNNICPATLARCRLFAKQSDLEIKNSEPTGLTKRKVGFSDVSDTTWLWWPDWTKQKCSLYN